MNQRIGVIVGGRGIYDYYWFWRGTWYEHQNLRGRASRGFHFAALGRRSRV
jgi:hypothetical protein